MVLVIPGGHGAVSEPVAVASGGGGGGVGSLASGVVGSDGGM